MKNTKNTENGTNKKKIAAALLAVATVTVVAAGIFAFFRARERAIYESLPTVTIETPAKLSESDRDAFYVDVSLSEMGEAVYPAVSLSLAFDSYHLEFLGIEEGNIPVRSLQNEYALPNWSVNVEHSNTSGVIRTMYLDLTGGTEAFSNDCMHTDGRKNVLLRLKFRLRGNARAGEVYGIVAEDICFAAHDSAESLATETGSLRAIDGRVAVGE